MFTLTDLCFSFQITIFDSESEDHLEADVAILTASLRGIGNTVQFSKEHHFRSTVQT